MTEKEWLFNEFDISPNSILGICLRNEIKKVSEGDNNMGNEEIRRLSLENLGKTIGCEIKANDFLALGAKEYLELRKEVRTRIRQKINRLREKVEK